MDRAFASGANSVGSIPIIHICKYMKKDHTRVLIYSGVVIFYMLYFITASEFLISIVSSVCLIDNFFNLSIRQFFPSEGVWDSVLIFLKISNMYFILLFSGRFSSFIYAYRSSFANLTNDNAGLQCSSISNELIKNKNDHTRGEYRLTPVWSFLFYHLQFLM